MDTMGKLEGARQGGFLRKPRKDQRGEERNFKCIVWNVAGVKGKQ